MKQTGLSDAKIEKTLRRISQLNRVEPAQDAIDSTITKACVLLEEGCSETRIKFIEFVAIQIRFMQKKWWVLQAILLILATEWIMISGDTNYMYRGLSIWASLFVILIIPELWKNFECRSFEIEDATWFDLRRVYAAKLIAFGTIDTVLLTIFCIFAAQIEEILFADVLKQFVFPIMIAATICMISFSKKKKWNEVTTMIICIISNLIWMILVSVEEVYSRITPLLWIGLFVVCSSIIAYCVYKALQRREEYWEVHIREFGVR